ncbi:MAG: 50S ribosomal protein L11 methyltransferase [Magnetococcales bacterium]|nr:50S ribosomal protein L11 methyltransferase [Magnetococcales bacterium]
MTWELHLGLSAILPPSVNEEIGLLLHDQGATAIVIADASPAGGVFSRDETFAASRLTAYFPPDHDPPTTDLALRLFLLSRGVTDDPATRWRQLANQDWQEKWKEGITPQYVGERFLIVPTWIDPSPSETSRLLIRLDPEMAFGSGSHATTRMCLIAMAERAIDHPLGDFLDLGTGSGILAIGAALLQAASITATDNDPIAIATSRQNYQRNRQTNFPPLCCLETDQIPQGLFHTVVANILAPTLLAMLEPKRKPNAGTSPALTDALTPGGFLILSGILVEQEDLIVAACDRAGFKQVRTRRQEEWSLVTACKSSL